MKQNLHDIPTDLVTIAPSLLAANFGCLEQEVRGVEAAGADLLHIDIMDGHFVPNLSMGPAIVAALRPHTALFFDVHLMVSHPSHYIVPFSDAGADHITFHVEADDDVAATIAQVRETGCSVGLSLKPGTPASHLRPYLDLVDLILVMTVEPGFGGQSFMMDQLDKAREIRSWIDESNRPLHLEADGGIGPDNAAAAAAAGINMLVAGTSIFRAEAGVAAAISLIRSTAAH